MSDGRDRCKQRSQAEVRRVSGRRRLWLSHQLSARRTHASALGRTNVLAMTLLLFTTTLSSADSAVSPNIIAFPTEEVQDFVDWRSAWQ